MVKQHVIVSGVAVVIPRDQWRCLQSNLRTVRYNISLLHQAVTDKQIPPGI